MQSYGLLWCRFHPLWKFLAEKLMKIWWFLLNVPKYQLNIHIIFYGASANQKWWLFSNFTRNFQTKSSNFHPFLRQEFLKKGGTLFENVPSLTVFGKLWEIEVAQNNYELYGTSLKYLQTNNIVICTLNFLKLTCIAYILVVVGIEEKLHLCLYAFDRLCTCNLYITRTRSLIFIRAIARYIANCCCCFGVLHHIHRMQPGIIFKRNDIQNFNVIITHGK